MGGSDKVSRNKEAGVDTRDGELECRENHTTGSTKNRATDLVTDSVLGDHLIIWHSLDFVFVTRTHDTHTHTFVLDICKLQAPLVSESPWTMDHASLVLWAGTRGSLCSRPTV